MSERKGIAEGLARLLADTYTLYLKTQSFHWNVKGPMFTSLHLLFEQQYTELALAIDEVAERIRALGYPAPGSYAQFGRLKSIPEEEGVPSADAMLRQLIDGQAAIVKTASAAMPTAVKLEDAPTVDLLTRRIQIHEKNAWMLRALLSED